jgi:hypothetical protein
MEATDLEAYPEEMKSIAVHEEDPMENATLKYSGTMKKRHRGRHLATERRREPKELTQGDPGGSWLPPTGRCPTVQQWRGVREMNIFRKIRTQGNC